MPPSLTSTASSTIPSIPAPLRRPLLALTALYFFPLWALDGMQLALSIIQLKGGPVARSDPSGVSLTFPPAAEHLQRLAIACASLGVVAHAVLGVMLPAAVGGLARRVGEEDPDGGGEGEGEGARVVWEDGRGGAGVRGKARRRLAGGCWMPWSVLSLGVWSVYVGMQTGVYVPDVKGSVPECGKWPGMSQCGLVHATWIIGMIYL